MHPTFVRVLLLRVCRVPIDFELPTVFDPIGLGCMLAGRCRACIPCILGQATDVFPASTVITCAAGVAVAPGTVVLPTGNQAPLLDPALAWLPSALAPLEYEIPPGMKAPAAGGTSTMAFQAAVAAAMRGDAALHMEVARLCQMRSYYGGDRLVLLGGRMARFSDPAVLPEHIKEWFATFHPRVNMGNTRHKQALVEKALEELGRGDEFEQMTKANQAATAARYAAARALARREQAQPMLQPVQQSALPRAHSGQVHQMAPDAALHGEQQAMSHGTAGAAVSGAACVGSVQPSAANPLLPGEAVVGLLPAVEPAPPCPQPGQPVFSQPVLDMLRAIQSGHAPGPPSPAAMSAMVALPQLWPEPALWEAWWAVTLHVAPLT